MLCYRTLLLAQTGICFGYTTSVIGFINKCIDDVIPTVTVHTYPNQKPWITGNILIELKARAAAFKERDTNPDTLRRTIKQSKLQYRIKIESCYPGSDARRMWQGLKTVTDSRSPAASCPDKCLLRSLRGKQH
jgi:hypothetical protein